ncbi:MAG: tetratricopeptide repeat protein [Acidobacteria bacterium]|nr:tetratricopeptide repeat protein [Acidobacteriota bacterium]
MSDPLLVQFQALLDAYQSAGDPGERVRLLLDQQLEPEEAEHLRRCAIPHQFSLRVFRLLAPELDADRAALRFGEFARLSVMQPAGESLALHDGVRTQLFRQWLAPERRPEFAALSRRLAGHYAEARKEAGGEAERVCARRWMFHLIGASEPEGIQALREMCRAARIAMQTGEFEALVRLAFEYSGALSPSGDAALDYQAAKLLYDKGELEAAETAFRELLDNPASPVPVRVKSLGRLGLILTQLRRWKEAVARLEEAIHLSHESGFEDDLPGLLHDLGAAWRDSGNLVRGARFLKESLKVAEARGRTKAMARGYNSLGTLYRKSSRPQEAIRAYEKSLECLDQLGDRFGKPAVYNNLGAVRADLAEWDKSESYYRQSLEIKEQAGDTLGRACTLGNLARVYRSQQRVDLAVQTAETAVQLFGELRDDYRAAGMHLQLARIYRSQKRIDDAKREYSSAIAQWELVQATEEAKEARIELKDYQRRRGLPWWFWVVASALLLFVALMMAVVVLLAMIFKK